MAAFQAKSSASTKSTPCLARLATRLLSFQSYCMVYCIYKIAGCQLWVKDTILKILCANALFLPLVITGATNFFWSFVLTCHLGSLTRFLPFVVDKQTVQQFFFNGHMSSFFKVGFRSTPEWPFTQTILHPLIQIIPPFFSPISSRLLLWLNCCFCLNLEN
jgi:hypothetical protein